MKVARTVVALSMIGAASAVAQQSVPGTASPSGAAPAVIRVSTQLVELDALVEDKKTGHPVSGLEAKDFLVKEDGVPQSISYFSHDELPLSVVFLFDLTDTVRPILKPLAAGALGVLSHLKPEDEVSVMVFSSHTELLQEFTTDRSLAAAAIAKAAQMKSTDGTFIHEDMYEAVDQGTRSTIHGSRRVLVWLTDGTANLENSMTQKTIGKGAPAHLRKREEATASLAHSGITVAALIDRSAGTDAMVAFMDISPFSFLGGGRMGDINRYAEMTGGPVLHTSTKQVAARLSELIDELRERYTLGYKPSTEKAEGTYCKLGLTVDMAGKKEEADLRNGVVVRTKKGYYR